MVQVEYVLKVIAARILRGLIKLALKLKTLSQSSFPKPATRITLAKIIDSSNSNSSSKSKSSSIRRIPIDVYLPKSSLAKSDKPLPVVINLHGSGFMIYAFGDDAPFCQLVADQVNCVVLDVDYSKAPEYPFPNADEEVDSILEWVIEKKEIERKLKDYGITISSNKVAFTGFSSGGKLALTGCVRAKQSSRLDHVKAVIAFYPSTNLAESPYEKPKMKPAKGEAGSVVPPFLRQFFYSSYIPHSQSTPRSDPTISPLNASSDSFPHSVSIFTCQGDSLAREAQQLANKIKKERNSDETETVQKETVTNGVLWWEAEGQGHAWDKQCKNGSGAAQKRDYSYSLAVDRLKAAFT